MSRFRLDLFSLSQRVMQMDDQTWQRHANPLSVYSRMSILPLMSLAIWSRYWLGWGALAPILMVLIWTWWNPRAFPPPAHGYSWASEGTFGERVLLNARKVPIPAHHSRWARGLALATAAGLPFWIYGLWHFDPGFTLCGLSVLIGGKLWFVDRMVWLYRDMKLATAQYASWQDGDSSAPPSDGTPSAHHR